MSMGAFTALLDRLRWFASTPTVNGLGVFLLPGRFDRQTLGLESGGFASICCFGCEFGDLAASRAGGSFFRGGAHGGFVFGLGGGGEGVEGVAVGAVETIADVTGIRCLKRCHAARWHHARRCFVRPNHVRGRYAVLPNWHAIAPLQATVTLNDHRLAIGHGLLHQAGEFFGRGVGVRSSDVDADGIVVEVHRLPIGLVVGNSLVGSGECLCPVGAVLLSEPRVQ